MTTIIIIEAITLKEIDTQSGIILPNRRQKNKNNGNSSKNNNNSNNINNKGTKVRKKIMVETELKESQR